MITKERLSELIEQKATVYFFDKDKNEVVDVPLEIIFSIAKTPDDLRFISGEITNIFLTDFKNSVFELYKNGELDKSCFESFYSTWCLHKSSDYSILSKLYENKNDANIKLKFIEEWIFENKNFVCYRLCVYELCYYYLKSKEDGHIAFIADSYKTVLDFIYELFEGEE